MPKVLTSMKTKWVREKFYPTAVKQEWIRLLYSTYITLFIASFISFNFFELETWNNWDKFAVTCHMIGVVTTFGFFIFIIWFVWFKSTRFLTKIKLERE